LIVLGDAAADLLASGRAETGLATSGAEAAGLAKTNSPAATSGHHGLGRIGEGNVRSLRAVPIIVLRR